MQGRLGRLAEGEDDQGMPGVHRGPHSWLQVHPELSPLFYFLVFSIHVLCTQVQVPDQG